MKIELILSIIQTAFTMFAVILSLYQIKIGKDVISNPNIDIEKAKSKERWGSVVRIIALILSIYLIIDIYRSDEPFNKIEIIRFIYCISVVFFMLNLFALDLFVLWIIEPHGKRIEEQIKLVYEKLSTASKRLKNLKKE